MTRYFRRHWDEDPGLELAGWGSSEWLFMTDEAGNVTRQVEVFGNGNVLDYDLNHVKDDYGMLADKPLDLPDSARFEITAEEFARKIEGLQPVNR